MVVKYDNNHLVEFKEVLFKELNKYRNALQNDDGVLVQSKLVNQDAMLKVILQNNGCSFKDDAFIYYPEEFTLKEDNSTYLAEINDHYRIIFIYGGMGNKINNSFDYVYFYGMQYLVIFMDFFKDLFIKEDEDETAKEILGNYEYADAIAKITELFIHTAIHPLSNLIDKTAAGNMFRFASHLVAAKILYDLDMLYEGDISVIRHEDLIKMITEIPEELLFSGVKFM